MTGRRRTSTLMILGRGGGRAWSVMMSRSRGELEVDAARERVDAALVRVASERRELRQTVSILLAKVDRLREQATEASSQAWYWRARALELGASADEDKNR